MGLFGESGEQVEKDQKQVLGLLEKAEQARSKVLQGEWTVRSAYSSVVKDVRRSDVADYHIWLSNDDLRVDCNAHRSPDGSKSREVNVVRKDKKIVYFDFSGNAVQVASKIVDPWDGVKQSGELVPHPLQLGLSTSIWENSVYSNPYHPIELLQSCKNLEMSSRNDSDVEVMSILGKLLIKGENIDLIVEIAPELDYGVLAVELRWSVGGVPHRSRNQSSLVKSQPSGLFFPNQVVYTKEVDGLEAERQELKIDTLNLNQNVDSGVFQFEGIDARKGTVVGWYPGRGDFIWDGRRLVPRDVGSDPSSKPIALKDGGDISSFRIVIISNIAALIVIAAFFVFRSLRKKDVG